MSSQGLECVGWQCWGVPRCHVHVAACGLTAKQPKMWWRTRSASLLAFCPFCQTSAVHLLHGFWLVFFPTFFSSLFIFSSVTTTSMLFFFSPPPSCYRVLDISEQVMRNNLHLCRHVGSDLFLWLASLWILVLVAHCAWEWLLCFHSFKCWINNSKTCTSLNNEDCSSNWVNPLLALTAFTRLLSYGES